MTMRRPSFKRPRRQLDHGFTMIELAIAVLVLGILSGTFAYSIGLANWRRQRVNAVTEQLAGWIEEVMAYSMRENVQCDITITTGTALQPGSEIARVVPPNPLPTTPYCNPVRLREASFRIPGLVLPAGDSFRIGPNGSSGSPIIFTYTPRGTLFTSSQSNPADLEIRVALNPGGRPPERPLRCIRLSSTLGLISLGRNNTATAPDPDSDSCIEYDAI